jgi:phosphonate transport system permease protein
MNSAITNLSEEAVKPLERNYARAIAARRRRAFLVILILAAGVAVSAAGAEVNLEKFWNGLPRFSSYFYDILPVLHLSTLSTDLAAWYWNWDGWLVLLFETLVVAYVGTGLGAISAFCLGFLASRNLNRHRASQVLVRRILEFFRTVPDIVFALLFVYALGLGPIPGVIAISLHTTGALGKLFSEAVENVEQTPIDGLNATGANWFEAVRFAVLPQVLSNFVSYTLLRFEINVRGASVMGFVGAGGIGKELLSSIRQFYYSDVSAILFMLIFTVVIIDLLTENIRHRFLDIKGY